MFNNMWDVKEPKHYSKGVGREVPGVVAVLCVGNTGPMLIAVTTITEMVILYKYVEMMKQSMNRRGSHWFPKVSEPVSQIARQSDGQTIGLIVCSSMNL